MPDIPPHGASLTVLAGPSKGQRLVLDEAVDDVLIGSDPDCQLCLDLPGVSPIHARIWLDPNGTTVFDTHSAAGVFVNDDRVSERAPLRDGDIVWLGPPAEPDSVMLQYRHPGASPAAPPPEASRPVVAATAAAPLVAEVQAVMDDAEWLIEEDVGEAAAPEASPGDPLEEMLVEEEPPPPDEFFVAEEPPPAPPGAELPAATVDEDLFEWGGTPAAAPEPDRGSAYTPEYVEEQAPEAAQQEPMALDDWSASAEWPSEPPPATAPETAPVPAPRVPAPMPPAIPAAAIPLDDDVFYVEEPEAPVAPARPVAPAPPPPPPAPPVAAPRVPAQTAPPPPPPAMAPAPARLDSPPPRRPAPVREPRDREPQPRAAASRAAAAEAAPRRKAPAGKGPLLLGAGLLLALAAAGLVALQFLRAPRVDRVEPVRVRAGDTITVHGRNFSADPASVVVRFEGSREGRILRASPTRLEVEVPPIPAASGRVNTVPVQVHVGGRESKPFEISVFQAPRIHGISPSVAMPGEEVTLAGADWGPGASVRFGTQPAQVLDVAPTAIRVRVPALDVAEGTRLPVVVSMGGDPSNEAPFFMGRLPLLLSVEPRTVPVGELLLIKGQGFAPQASANDVRIGGAHAVVVSASEAQMQVVVPRTPAEGDNALELRVPGHERAAQATLTVAPAADPIEFRFMVEHPASLGITDEAGHDHVVLSTGLGPVFLISAAQGQSAAERAVLAQQRLRDAAVALKASLTADLEVRGLEGQPTIGLVGKQEPVLVVTDEDAAAYEEDWARGKSKGEPVTAARLAIWWGAVARDLVLLLVRGDTPRHAAALGAEGRPLGTLHEAARRSGKFGVPQAVMAGAPPALRQGLRAIAFRVPAGARAPSTALVAEPVKPLALDGIWTGSEVEGGITRYMTVSFSAGGGTFTYERALSVTIPLVSVQQVSRKEARFGFRSGLRLREYRGTWDGQRVRGRITGEDGAEIGSFELERKR